MLTLKSRRSLVCSGLALLSAAAPLSAQSVDWPSYGGDLGFNRYSEADAINRSNVSELKVLWTRPAIDSETSAKYPRMRAGGYFKSTPIMIDGALYAPNGVGLAEAFDARTGHTIWVQAPPSDELRDLAGSPARGLAVWGQGGERRIFNLRGRFLYALDQATGQPIRAFGDGGRIELGSEDDGFSSSGGPLAVDDVVIVGGGHGYTADMTTETGGPPDEVRAFDARTGKLRWSFSTVPQPGDPARDTWRDGSVEQAGYMGSYGQMSADAQAGIVYVPLTTPNPNLYGGWRPGDNLYGTSLVALEVKTGKKVWHYQTVHHDIWDMDLAAPPVLGDITVNGTVVRAVMQTGKVPFLYTFDRITGEPVWPIVETPVPQSDVPGEITSPTQPIPSKPEPLDRFGFNENEVIDFTPELRAEAMRIVNGHRYNGMFTPPSLFVEGGNKGTLTLPGSEGSGNWNTGAFDPKTGTYYSMTVTAPMSFALEPTAEGAGVPYFVRNNAATWYVEGPRGLPLIKPPYSLITAVDMNEGKRKWAVPNGDGPRDHPELKGLALPQLGLPGRVAVVVTPELLFAPEASDSVPLTSTYGGGGNKFRAYDKVDGRVLAEVTMPAGATGAPITYEIDGRQFIVVAIADEKTEPQWVALGL